MDKTGKPNGGSNGSANGTSETLARIARLISAPEDPDAGPDAPDDGGAHGAPGIHDDSEKSPELAELTSAKLLEALPAGLAVCVGTRVVNMNTAFALAFGYRDAAELEDAGGAGALFVEDAGTVEARFLRAGKTGNRKIDLAARTRSGRVVTVPVAVHAIASQTDEPARLIVLHPQLSVLAEERAVEDKHAQARPETLDDGGSGEPANGDGPRNKKKKKSKAAKPAKVRSGDAGSPEMIEFLAKVSHELRTPLNSIIGFAELMKDEQLGPIGNERYRGYIRDIHDSGIYALSLINDLLDISKIKSGEFELNFAAVDLEEVIAESVQSMQPQAQRRRVLLRTSFSDTLPDVLADRRSVRQIVLNLVSNAIKFTMPGGQVIVSVLETESGGIRLRVRDTGIGMSKSEVAVAMKPYKQVEQDTMPHQVGTGLGLPLTKALVEANRARFKVRSAAGSGTRVDVTFPKERTASART